MRSNRKRFIKESKTNSIYDMIAAIENRIDELEDMDFYGEDYFESYKNIRESSKKKLTTVVSRAEWGKLRVFLKKNKIEYNPSEYGKDIHVQVWVDNDERKAVDDFLDTLDESYRRRGKRPMKENVSIEQIYDDVIEFFDAQGWDTYDDRVRSYASAVADHLYYEPDYRYPETLIQWLKDTRMNCPEEIEWMD